VGGTDALVTCLAGIVEAAGGELRMEAEVTDVKLRDRQVRGVVLADGEEIAAPVIISDLDFKRTILGLFQWKDIPGDLVEAAGRFRMKGTTAKLNLALDRQPRIEGVPRDCPALAGGLRLMGSLAEQDKAHACWHMNVVPQNPELSVFLPSLVDPALAPPGKHVMSVLVNWVPETPHDGPWTDEKKSRLTDAVLEKLETAMPGLRETVRTQEMWLPHEVENETGITSGDLDQGEMTLDQMFFNRPTPFGAPGGGYATPLKNFYLCSQSTHPGSLLPARAGANTAAAILASMKRRQGA
jgi:phytoene dehydrogenase-like protein